MFCTGPNGLAKYESTKPFSLVVPLAILFPALNTGIASSAELKNSISSPSS